MVDNAAIAAAAKIAEPGKGNWEFQVPIKLDSVIHALRLFAAISVRNPFPPRMAFELINNPADSKLLTRLNLMRMFEDFEIGQAQTTSLRIGICQLNRSIDPTRTNPISKHLGIVH